MFSKNDDIYIIAKIVWNEVKKKERRVFQIKTGKMNKPSTKKNKNQISGVEKQRGKKQQEKTIQRQIFKGYFLFSGIVLFLVVISILMMAEIRREYEEVAAYQDHQEEAQSVIAAHYKWLEQLSESITTGTEFTGSLDPETCALGTWLNGDGAGLMNDPVIAESLNAITGPHEDIHLQASQLTELSLSNKDAAYRRYTYEFKPKIETIGEGLDAISSRLQETADSTKERARNIALITQVLLLLAGMGAVVISLLAGRRISKKNIRADPEDVRLAGGDIYRY